MTEVQVVDERGWTLMTEQVEHNWERLVTHMLDDGFKKTREDSDEVELVKVVGFSVLTVFITKEDLAT
jgi:hypothetical protein